MAISKPVIGRKVVYKGQIGTIAEFNEKFIYVLFGLRTREKPIPLPRESLEYATPIKK